MKKVVTILFITLAAHTLNAQNMSFSWAKHFGAYEYDNGWSIAVDGSGNVYTTGYFLGTVDFDPGPGVFNLVAIGDGDAFVCKMNSAGNFIWAKQMAARESSQGFSVTVDAAGNVYTTGNFSGTVDFDPGAAVYNLTSIGNGDIFVSKLDMAGNFVWAKRMGGPDYSIHGEHGFSIALDASGNVYTYGMFSSTADFDPGLGIFNLSCSPPYNVFISKLDAAGNFIWAKQMGGDISTEGYSLAIDAAGNIYTSGHFYGTADFDPSANVFNLSAVGRPDIFISKLDANGNFIWAKQIGGNGNISNCRSIATDASGISYITGCFAGTSDFDPGAGVFNLSAFGVIDIFVLKLGVAGNFLWAKQMGGTASDFGRSITVDPAGNVYTTGQFKGTADFDPGVCEFNLSSFGNDDIFISKLDADGNFIYATQMGGSGSDIGTSIAAAAAGNVFTTGVFSDVADFDPGIGSYPVSSSGYYDVFIQKMIACPDSTSSSITISACSSYTLGCNTYRSSGVYTQRFINAAGCDSIVTLNLTVGTITSTMNVAACNEYYWNGQLYKSSGIYKDTLVSSNGCDSIVILALTINPGSFVSINQSICQGQHYLGYTTSGTYIDTFAAANGCDSIRTLFLKVLSRPAPDLGPDQYLCSIDSLVLFPGEFSTYLWQDGTLKPRLLIKQPGLYSVTVTNNCGSGKDEVMVKPGTCDTWFPSAFTPDNDGKNDIFKALGKIQASEFNLVVYDRWGLKVFSTKDPAQGWDGKFKGQLQSMGAYTWVCSFKNPNRTLKGTVLLIR